MLPFFRLAPVPDSEPDANATGSIRIVLADDHAAMRQSLRLLLDGEADIDVIAETDCLTAVMAQVHARRPDVLVLDLGMSSRGSGIAALDKLSREMRDISIVVLTMNDDPTFAKRALENGALGLVLKEMADEDLPAATFQPDMTEIPRPPPHRASARRAIRPRNLDPPPSIARRKICSPP